MSNYYEDGDAYIALHYGENNKEYLRAVVPPIYMNSLHTFARIEDYYNVPQGAYLYGRYNNPTVEIVERKIAALEQGKRAFLYASGMAAATAAVMAVCRSGDHVVCVHNAYGPLQSFLIDYCSKDLDITVTFVRGDSMEELRKAVQDNTSLMILETPGSATFSLVDLKEVARLARENHIVTYVDNSYCSPEFQKPLTLGIDMVMHSTTKYLGGHSDLIGGVLVTSHEGLMGRLGQQRPWFGGIMGPMEAWLLMRGLRTLHVRMKHHEETALEIARSLEKNPRVRKVYYPGLESHPQYELAKRQQTGSSGLLSFEVNASPAKAVQVINRLRVFQIGPSWGGFESLAIMPLLKNTDEYAQWYGASRGIIRIHCGLEGAGVLLKDIEQALEIIS
ncbi:MAG: PLP-dependent transferase [Lachnospiraceae bacterium]|nr:PLP-dependent transferase [Lachnospiraceae bacterium]